MKKRWIIVIVVLLVILVGGFLLGKRSSTPPLESKALLDNAEILDPKMLTVVEKGELQKTVSATGYLKSRKEKTLSFSANGKVEEIRVAEGETVKSGEILMQIDKKQQEANFLKAQRAHDTAKINGAAIDIRESELNLNIAREGLEATTLKAPFAGRITEVLIEKGDFIAGGQPIAKLVDDSGYEIEVTVDESDSHLIQVGQPVNITLNALPGKKFKGEVIKISFETQNLNGIVRVPVTVLLKEESAEFKPGYSTDLEIVVNSVADQLLVPVTAIFNDKGQEKVVKVVNDKPVLTPVKIGLSNGVKSIVEEGLKPGDKVLTNAYKYAGVDPEENMRFMMGGNRNRSTESRGDN